LIERDVSTAPHEINAFFMLHLRFVLRRFSARLAPPKCDWLTWPGHQMSLHPQPRLTPRAAEETMKAANRAWRYLGMPISLAAMLSISSAAELNPAAVIYKLPDQIP
jgi:hypothetical protein